MLVRLVHDWLAYQTRPPLEMPLGLFHRFGLECSRCLPWPLIDMWLCFRRRGDPMKTILCVHHTACEDGAEIGFSIASVHALPPLVISGWPESRRCGSNQRLTSFLVISEKKRLVSIKGKYEEDAANQKA